MEFSEKVGNGPVNKWLNFGGDPDHRLQIQGLFSGFVTIGIYGKWLTDINLLLILICLICQMTALLRRALAEVYTVPVLLVIFSNSALRQRSYVSSKPSVKPTALTTSFNEAYSRDGC